MIIGISGKIGSGKTTLSNILIQKLAKRGIKAEEKSFAHKLKEITSILTGFPVEEMYTHEGKNRFINSFGMTIGQMQQKIGTEVMRDNFDQDVWIKALFNSYKDGEVWIISDVRFENEANAILQHPNHRLIRLNGDPVGVNKESTRDKAHASETSLDNFGRFTNIFDNRISDIKFINDYAEAIVWSIESVICSPERKA